MPKPQTVAELTELGRVRLSEHFFMREMLYSEVANLYGLPNIPDDPDLAIAAGETLCRLVLEPLRRAFGHVAVRSAYRSPSVNDFCHQRYKQGDTACFCSDNGYNRARHIWDQRDDQGFSGATVSVVVPSYIGHYEETGDWQALGWWIRDNIADYEEVIFMPWLCAFNIRWYEGPSKRTIRRSDGINRSVLTEDGMANAAGDHRTLYQAALAPILRPS
jgi:hypothetical protein